MKILITGHRGFIGRHFAERFAGHEVVGVDIKDGQDVRDWFRRDERVFDLVVHCAAIVEGRGTIDGEPLRVATNLSIDSEFFNWAVRTKQKKLVCFSSSAAYPLEVQNSKEDLLSCEDMVSLTTIKIPDQTYGFSKITLELLADIAKNTVPDMEVYVFRPFSGYGTDQSPDYPFISFINRIKQRVSEFECWGDGEQVRDWIHVDDIVEAVMAAVEKKVEGPVNLSTGRGLSMNQVIGMAMDISGHHVPVKHLLDKPVGVRYRVGDPTLMNTFYTAKISLEEGIRRCFEI